MEVCKMIMEGKIGFNRTFMELKLQAVSLFSSWESASEL